MTSPACPDSQQLEQLATGDASLERAAEVAAHVSACPECGAALEDIRQNLKYAAGLRQFEHQPTRIGRFRIVREIGRGGMGVVYEAQQEEPARRVAVKVLRRMDGSDRLLKREAAALARLSHPAIASIFEAGRADDGRPYLVMELVPGRSLTHSAHDERLTPTQRIELFLKVSEGVAAAHRQSVVHRDLKPSNIIVTPEGHPKVLDFGLAKLLHEGGQTLETEPGRIAGTIAYMSPEQARGDVAAIDTRTDVYALGVVLYELLTGELPYRVSAENIAASIRTIVEIAPTRPSTHGIRGDLEAVILKAIEKDPARRYQSVAALADDLGRVLRREPVTAKAPTAAYQLRKLVARYPFASTLAAALVASVGVFGIAMTGLYLRATRAEASAEASAEEARGEAQRATSAEAKAESAAREAREEARTAWETQEFLVKLFSRGDGTRPTGEPLTALDLVNEGTEQIASSLRDRPRIRTELMRVLATVHGEVQNDAKAVELYEEAMATAAALRDLSPLVEARVLRDYGSFLALRGETRGAEMLAQAVAIFERVGAEDFGQQQAVVLLMQALARTRDPVGAERPLRELVAFLERHPHHHGDLPAALNMLGGSLDRQEKYEEALEVMLRAVEIARRQHGDVTPDTAACLNNAASVAAALGRLEQAETLAREGLDIRVRIFGEDHMVTASSQLGLGKILLKLHRADEALGHLEAAHKTWSSAFAAGSSPVAEIEGVLGECLLELGRLDEAEPLLLSSEASVAGRASALPRDRRESAERLIRLFEARGDAEGTRQWREKLLDRQ